MSVYDAFIIGILSYWLGYMEGFLHFEAKEGEKDGRCNCRKTH